MKRKHGSPGYPFWWKALVTSLCTLIGGGMLLVLVGPAYVATVKAAFFSAEMLPQLPIRPLRLVEGPPRRETLDIWWEEGDREATKIIADLTIPGGGGPHPAMLVAIAVLGAGDSHQTLDDFSDTLGRMGFVVIWPRRAVVEEGVSRFEDPGTFIRGVQYLLSRPDVDVGRISMLGMSSGASLALVAAEDPSIRDSVRSIVFFAGYFNIESYLASVASKSMTVDGAVVEWEPDPWLTWFAGQMLPVDGLTLSDFHDVPPGTRFPRLDRLSPDRHIDQVRARIFILHDRSDNLVPYPQSLELKSALAGHVPVTYLESDMFQHVSFDVPEKRFSPAAIREVLALQWFLQQVFLYV